MKIGSKLQYEIPDKCPKNCKLHPKEYYQGSACTWCPLMQCKIMPADPLIGATEPWCMVEPTDYRDDWAKEFEDFFKTGKRPALKLKRSKE